MFDECSGGSGHSKDSNGSHGSDGYNKLRHNCYWLVISCLSV